jgi:hypothetical protein
VDPREQHNGVKGQMLWPGDRDPLSLYKPGPISQRLRFDNGATVRSKTDVKAAALHSIVGL